MYATVIFSSSSVDKLERLVPVFEAEGYWDIETNYTAKRHLSVTLHGVPQDDLQLCLRVARQLHVLMEIK